MFHTLRKPDILSITLAAAGLLMIIMGVRQSLGLFVTPIMSSTGLSIATLSLAPAVSSPGSDSAHHRRFGRPLQAASGADWRDRGHGFG